MGIWDFPAKEVEIPALEQVSLISVIKYSFGEKAWGVVSFLFCCSERGLDEIC